MTADPCSSLTLVSVRSSGTSARTRKPSISSATSRIRKKRLRNCSITRSSEHCLPTLPFIPHFLTFFAHDSQFSSDNLSILVVKTKLGASAAKVDGFVEGTPEGDSP